VQGFSPARREGRPEGLHYSSPQAGLKACTTGVM